MHHDPLQQIPGVGPNIAQDLRSLGINKIADLKNQNPQQLYDQLTQQVGQHVDRCVLYVFRCAAYYASHTKHDPEKLKWWHWKD